MSAAVVQLPTAAPKKVRQCPSRTKAADWDALLRFPDIYKPGWERAREKRATEQAHEMLEADHRTAILLVCIIYNVLNDEQRARVRGQLLGHLALSKSSAPRSALAWLKFHDDSYSGRLDLKNALAAIVGEGA